ncbi:MAG: immunity 42 family protein [Ignavibacteria bacterium]|nr:immunity 42 family protein [Ignavibacteria bacterium]
MEAILKVFGEKSYFAIQCKVENKEGKNIFGEIIIWINNLKMGDEKIYELLNGPTFITLKEVFNTTIFPNGELFTGMDTEEILFTVMDALYGDQDIDARSIQELDNKVKLYNKFNLFPDGSNTFDHIQAVLFERDKKIIVIWKDINYQFINSFLFEENKLKVVIKEYINFIENLEE